MPSPCILSVGLAAACGLAAAQYNAQQALTLAYYSGIAYCDASQVSAWVCKPCAHVPAQNVVFMNNYSMDVAGYVAKQSDGTIVVSFRGTNPLDLKDWIDDLWFSPHSIPYPGCSACHLHTGFYNGYVELAGDMLSAIDAFGGKSAAGIVVTGHSLGAAIATISVFELILAGYPVTTHMDFGRPRVGDAAFATAFQEVVNTHNLSSVRIHTESHAPWSAVLTRAVQDAHARIGKADSASMVAAAVRDAAATFGKGAAVGAASPNRAARHAAAAHTLKAVQQRVYGAIDFSVLHTAASPTATSSYRLTHNADPVPHLPLEIMEFRHAAQEIWYDEAENSYRTCSATNGEDPTCSDSVPLDIDLFDHLNYMGLEIGLLC